MGEAAGLGGGMKDLELVPIHLHSLSPFLPQPDSETPDFGRDERPGAGGKGAAFLIGTPLRACCPPAGAATPPRSAPPPRRARRGSARLPALPCSLGRRR